MHQFSVTVLPMVMVCSCSFFWCFRGHKFVCFDGPIIHFYSLVLYLLITWLSINQNSLWCRMRLSVDKNLSVVVKFFFCHSPGCHMIHNPRQVCVDLINVNGFNLVPRNDFDSVFSLIKRPQLLLALFEALRICKKEFCLTN